MITEINCIRFWELVADVVRGTLADDEDEDEETGACVTDCVMEIDVGSLPGCEAEDVCGWRRERLLPDCKALASNC